MRVRQVTAKVGVDEGIGIALSLRNVTQRKREAAQREIMMARGIGCGFMLVRCCCRRCRSNLRSFARPF